MESNIMAVFSRRKADHDRVRAQQRAEEASTAMGPIAEMLRERFGVTEVRAFGSLIWGEPHLASDIDLAVAGLTNARYFEALAAAAELAPVPVDLVRMEDIGPSFRKRIQEEGRALDAQRPARTSHAPHRGGPPRQ